MSEPIEIKAVKVYKNIVFQIGFTEICVHLEHLEIKDERNLPRITIRSSGIQPELKSYGVAETTQAPLRVAEDRLKEATQTQPYFNPGSEWKTDKGFRVTIRTYDPGHRSYEILFQNLDVEKDVRPGILNAEGMCTSHDHVGRIVERRRGGEDKW